MKCGKCGSRSIRLETLHTEEDGIVDSLKCLTCGNTSDSKQYGFIVEESEMSVKAIGKCKNCEREGMALNMGYCGSCSGAWYKTGIGGLARAREKFFGKPKAEPHNKGGKRTDASMVAAKEPQKPEEKTRAPEVRRVEPEKPPDLAAPVIAEMEKGFSIIGKVVSAWRRVFGG